MIIYFSGTGNTYHAARTAAAETGDRLYHIGFDEIPATDNVIGIFSPVYFYGLPSDVIDCLKCIDASKAEYVYLFLTCGGSDGRASHSAYKLLHRLDAVYDTLMPDNFIRAYDPPTEGKVATLLSSAEFEITSAITKIKKREHGDFREHAGGELLYLALRSLYKPYGRRTAHFALSDSCIGCGKCVANCPSHAILMRSGKPVWIKQYCSGCLGCINRCPERAIQCGESTKKRGRYVHPDYK